MVAREQAGVEAPAESVRERLRAHYVLMMLFLANALAFVDRGVVAMIVEPLKADLGLSDSAIGVLTGFAFVTFYSLFGIPFARWADKGVRRGILALGVGLWSVATILCGLATNFWQLALARMAVGVGEAAGTPTSLSIISDYYRKADRPQAIAVFRASVFVASMVGIPITGLLTELYGWRLTFFVFGALGLPLALLIQFTVAEPQRGRFDPDAGPNPQPPPLRETMRIMFGHRPFVLLFTGMALYGVSGAIGGAWVPAFLMRIHDLSPAQVGALVPPVLSVSALLGTLFGGWLGGQMIRRGHSDRAAILVLLAAALVGVPTQAVFVFHDSLFWCLAGGGLASFFGAMKIGPFMALMLDWMPPAMRGLSAAMVVLATSLIPGGLAPLVVGLVSDALAAQSGEMALRYAMSLQPITLLLGTIVCGLSVFYLPGARHAGAKDSKLGLT